MALRVDSVASFTGNYYFGICSGTAAMPLDATTTNFVGLAGAAAGTVNWTRTLGTRFNHYVNSAGIMGNRDGVTTTVRSSNGSGLRVAEDVGNTLIISVMLERAHTSLSYIVTDYKCDANTAGFHSGKQSTQLTSFRSEVTEAIGPLTTSSTSGSFNMSEAPGVLDSFYFGWDSATPIEVAAINAVRHF
jgi:hypothetical protein